MSRRALARNILTEKIRIAKYLAQHNVCSRRDVDRLIAAGRVMVNQKTLTSPVCFVDDTDEICVDNKRVNSQKQSRVWLYYKPVGEITTHHDPQKRKTVFQSVRKKGLERVVSVGRLDINSEGLLLLTNSSEIAHALESPRLVWQRKYKVRVFGRFNAHRLQQWADDPTAARMILRNITLEGIRYAPIEIERERENLQGATEKNHRNFWCNVSLHEGKNREIRKIMAALGLQVNRLIRQAYGPFVLQGLKPGDLHEVPIEKVRTLIQNIDL